MELCFIDAQGLNIYMRVCVCVCVCVYIHGWMKLSLSALSVVETYLKVCEK